jgi:hypothetical protein
MDRCEILTTGQPEGQEMDKYGTLAVLRHTQAEVDALELHLEYKDLIWRKTPNAPSVQELLEHIAEAEQNLWRLLLPYCLDLTQQNIVTECFRIRSSRSAGSDSEQSIFRQLSTMRRITLILLENLEEPAWICPIVSPSGTKTVQERVHRFIEEHTVYLKGIRQILEELLALRHRGVAWN